MTLRTSIKEDHSLLLSVIIPTCRRNKALTACLQRLAPKNQTLSGSQYEVIVTDDGAGGEASAETLIRDSFPWVHWGAGPRRGPAANRNAGAAHARGKWIVFTDDDCLPAPSWLKAFADAVDAGDESQHVFEGRTTCAAGLTHPLEDAPVNLSGGYLWSCNMAIRHDIFKEIGGFDEDFPLAHMEDADLRERLKQRGIPFYFVEEAVVDHPPKRYSWRSAFGPYAESEIMYLYKHGQPGPHAARLLRQILHFRISWLLRAARTPQALLPITVISAREIFYILLRAASWDRKYGTRFPPPTSPL
ncbi:MAG: glycosyltransferase [Armatimonadota bacterium]